MLRQILYAAVLMLAGLTSVDVRAQTTPSGPMTVEQMLVSVDAEFIASGRVRPVDGLVGAMPAGEDSYRVHTLKPNTDYLVAGLCDINCSDLDLIVTTQREDLGEDREIDAKPIVAFRTGATEDVLIEAAMVDCSVAQCSYGYRIYEAIND